MNGAIVASITTIPSPEGNLMNALTILAVALIAAIVPSIIAARTHGALKSETKVIRDQLVNGHTSFLREDLDRALSLIEKLTHEVVSLRRDLALEQDSRRSQIDDLRGDVDRMRRRP